jgi:hypothetical protein
VLRAHAHHFRMAPMAPRTRARGKPGHPQTLDHLQASPTEKDRCLSALRPAGMHRAGPAPAAGHPAAQDRLAALPKLKLAAHHERIPARPLTS